MPYKPIKKEDIEQPEKSLMPPGLSPEATKELLGRLSDVKIYGLLLSADSNGALAEVIRSRWNELHHLSGDKFAVVAFDAPKEWAPAIEAYWRCQLGEQFETVWADWKERRGLEAGAAFLWGDLFDPPIPAKDLPCLVLFTSLQSKEAVMRSIPDWDADAIYRFLRTQFEAVRGCRDRPDDERLACVRDAMGSTGETLRTYMGHYAETTWQFLREHPATIVLTTVNLLVALGTGNVIPLTGTALAALTAVNEVFKKKS